MDDSLLTYEDDTNVTKETEASLSYEEKKPSKAINLKNHIITAISLNLMEIIKDNSCYEDFISKDKFFLDRIPSISLNDYIKRLVKYTGMDISTLIIAIIYIDTLCEKNNYILSMKNIYLLLLSSCLLSLKFNEDIKINLKSYAQIAGISLEILQNLEYSFCLYMQFEFFVKNELYQSYLDYFSNYEIPYSNEGK